MATLHTRQQILTIIRSILDAAQQGGESLLEAVWYPPLVDHEEGGYLVHVDGRLATIGSPGHQRGFHHLDDLLHASGSEADDADRELGLIVSSIQPIAPSRLEWLQEAVSNAFHDDGLLAWNAMQQGTLSTAQAFELLAEAKDEFILPRENGPQSNVTLVLKNDVHVVRLRRNAHGSLAWERQKIFNAGQTVKANRYERDVSGRGYCIKVPRGGLTLVKDRDVELS